MLRINPKNHDNEFSKTYKKMFYIGNQTIDVVEEYTYLGTKISSSGNQISLDFMPSSVSDATQTLVS